jgi:hypothetical protein
MAAFAVGADMRQEGMDAVQDAHEVDVEHPPPVIERDVVDAAAAGDAGIVANHMDIAEGRVGRLGRTLDACRIGNVTGNAPHVRPDIAQAFDGGRQRSCLDIGQHHLHACLREGPPERQADTARPARHEGRLAGELPHDPPLFRFLLYLPRYTGEVLPKGAEGKSPSKDFESAMI